jgi:hypothetical protein
MEIGIICSNLIEKNPHFINPGLGKTTLLKLVHMRDLKRQINSSMALVLRSDIDL